MPVSFGWLDETQRVLVVVHEATWTWHELFEATTNALDLIRAVEHPVHIVIDHRKEQHAPSDFAGVLSRFASLPMPPNIGLIIQVGTKGVTKIGNELFSMMYRKLHLVETMEDALALIRVYEERLANSSEHPAQE